MLLNKLNIIQWTFLRIQQIIVLDSRLIESHSNNRKEETDAQDRERDVL